MIPRPQHFGDRASFPCYWSGIVRIFEKPLIEALLLTAGGGAHYPGEQPDASIEDHHRSELAAGEHIIADRDRLEVSRLEDSFVETLETSGEENDPLAHYQFADAGLGQRLPARGQRQHRAAIRHAVERRPENVGPKHHPRSSACWRIVDALVLVGREIADVDGVERPDALLKRLPGQARAKRTRKHLGVKREDGGAERHDRRLRPEMNAPIKPPTSASNVNPPP